MKKVGSRERRNIAAAKMGRPLINHSSNMAGIATQYAPRNGMAPSIAATTII